MLTKNYLHFGVMVKSITFRLNPLAPSTLPIQKVDLPGKK